jgi:hypothetical protein
VRRDPVAARPLALLDDRLDRPPGRGQAGDREQLGPLEDAGDRLGPGRADEHGVFAVPGGQRQVQHLLLDHGDQRLFPGLHPGELAVGQALIRTALERELRVQVLTHHAVLDLAGLTQQIHQLLPGIDPQRRLGQRIARDVSRHGHHLTYESSRIRPAAE